MSNIDKQALLGADKHANQHRLSRLIIEANSAELRAIAESVEQYTDQLIAALADSEKRIAELEHYKSREERVTKLVLDNSTSWDALYKKLEAAERRITELESKLAKPVLLPKTNGYWNEQEKAYEEAITLAKRQVRLAGFNVEDM
ncbi:TPA_asm: ead/Ea22-like family protein [Salmonella enterica subsp. salamae serovar 58:d:z6]|uniref:Ead/Ea22-like family protein n=1 Tax=Salmonella enterica subsp. salamae serovar 58:d:z6 TaxID=41517 RepID=A0A737SCA7_SALER|nr:ead/Ea22-like family protein [Salmonella enterica]EAA6224098.1 ead/Ea22-like family protein [Salmonella enterica subsp. salamae]ECG1421849.1 ead/Ea22-like family protein [Salmonella enterica subsp. salamae str. CFSAN000559]HAE2716452.1 ead/Ea22-like family protein [Salmonella enterica subsp. salamae serovar 58:d:z6]HAE2990489.1 ead/Ea22-like family protein [Salmonella enterica subsp. salamae serovar 58:d:z6]HAE4548204.1 ead/Ea22-like family protein [Salmonella enterica subsp. salamae serova